MSQYHNQLNELKKLLELSVINNDHYERGRYLYNIKNDDIIIEATKLLQNNGGYKELLVLSK